MITNSKIFDKIHNIEVFKAFSSKGIIYYDKEKYTQFYIVKSYDTDILKIDLFNKVLVFDNQFYSKTTSRLQNIIKKALAFVFIGYDVGKRELLTINY